MMTLKEFTALLQDELAIQVEEISSDATFRDLRNWSSLNALLIISRLHEVTGQLISPNELANVKTVEQFYGLLKS